MPFIPQVFVSLLSGCIANRLIGSTGKPKGVDVMHGNVTNALLLEPGKLGICIGSKVAQVLNISFDMGKLRLIMAM